MRHKIERQIGFEVTAIVFVSVMAFEVFEIIQGETPTMGTLPQFFVLVGALGVFLFPLLLMRLKKRIGQPLREISDHLEDMSRGVFEEWEYSGANNEVERFEEVLNRLSEHNKEVQTSWRMDSFAAAPRIEKLRAREDLPEELRATLNGVWNRLRDVDLIVLEVFAPSPHFTRKRTVPDRFLAGTRLETLMSSDRFTKRDEEMNPGNGPLRAWEETNATFPAGVTEVGV